MGTENHSSNYGHHFSSQHLQLLGDLPRTHPGRGRLLAGRLRLSLGFITASNGPSFGPNAQLFSWCNISLRLPLYLYVDVSPKLQILKRNKGVAMKSRKNNSNRTLGFQPLEDRKMMTANLISKVTAVPKLVEPNVTTSVSSKGILTITGDGLADNIAISQTAPNEFTITGLNGTTINKTHTAESFPGVKSDVDISLNSTVGIAPTVSIQSNNGITFANNLNVNMGNGNSSFYMSDATVKGSMTLTGGNGNDTASIYYTTVGNATVNNGANDMTIQLGGGLNNVSVGDFTTVERDLNVLDPSSNQDAIYMGNSVSAGRYIYLVTGKGNDTVNLTGVNAGSQLNIQTGAGNDNVSLGGLDWDGSIGWVGAGAVSVNLGAGNDSLTFGYNGAGGIGVRGTATYEGGTGTDHAYNDTVLALTGSFTDFEIDLPFGGGEVSY
jgi:hypothetical protein